MTGTKGERRLEGTPPPISVWLTTIVLLGMVGAGLIVLLILDVDIFSLLA